MRRSTSKAVARALLLACAAVAAPGLMRAPIAWAGPVTSPNWSGYAVHGSGLAFQSVSGIWKQPSARCAAGPAFTSSTIWVGLGGYGSGSRPIEQIGTELDCSSGPHAVSSAWYQIVLDRAVLIRMPIHAGDRMLASVTTTGELVTLQLTNLTRELAFLKTLRVPERNVTSAEWIVEAPSWCRGAAPCQTRPLTNFGSVHFSATRAQAASGRSGPISSPRWRATRIMLISSPLQWRPADLFGISTPLPLKTAGSSFEVDYAQMPASRLSSLLKLG